MNKSDIKFWAVVHRLPSNIIGIRSLVLFQDTEPNIIDTYKNRTIYISQNTLNCVYYHVHFHTYFFRCYFLIPEHGRSSPTQPSSVNIKIGSDFKQHVISWNFTVISRLIYTVKKTQLGVIY